jgi:hypothetical protein
MSNSDFVSFLKTSHPLPSNSPLIPEEMSGKSFALAQELVCKYEKIKRNSNVK